MPFQKLLQRLRHSARVGTSLMERNRDLLRHVTRPALRRVERRDAHRVAILTIQQIADQRVAISGSCVGFAPRAAEPTEVIEHKVDVPVSSSGMIDGEGRMTPPSLARVACCRRARRKK